VTAVTAIRARLLTVSAVTALVAARVYVELLPQESTLPAIVVRLVDQHEPMHLRGPVGVNQSRVQVDAIATTKAGADALDAAVHGDGLGTGASGLLGWIGSLGSPAFEVLAVAPLDRLDGYEAVEVKAFRVMRDYRVTWRQL
jgi:hypothetical protein